MKVVIKEGDDKRQIDKKLGKLKVGKRFQADKYLGKIKVEGDALAIQKKLRDGWKKRMG
jgi:hypothetical protein